MASVDENIHKTEFFPISDVEKKDMKKNDVEIGMEQEQILMEEIVEIKTESKKSLQERIQKAVDENTLFPSDEIK